MVDERKAVWAHSRELRVANELALKLETVVVERSKTDELDDAVVRFKGLDLGGGFELQRCVSEYWVARERAAQLNLLPRRVLASEGGEEPLPDACVHRTRVEDGRA